MAFVVVQLLLTKIVYFYDIKSMKLCQITNIPNTNISEYGAKPNSPLDSSTAQNSKTGVHESEAGNRNASNIPSSSSR